MTTAFIERLERVQEELLRRRLGGVIVQNRMSSLYLSGFPCSNSLILITKRSAQFFTDFRYIEKASKSISHMEVIQMPQNTLTMVGEQLSRQRLRRVGFEESISFAEYTALSKNFGAGVELVPSGSIVKDLRLIKSADEIRQIASNQQLNQQIFTAAVASVTRSSREVDLRNFIRNEMIRHNSEEAFDSIVAAGTNSALPHAVAGAARVKNNNLLLFDMGVKRNHYHSDMTRTVAVGDRLSTRAAEIYEVVRQAQAAALKKVGPNVPCVDIDTEARKVIADAGYGDFFGHGLGHGVGLEIHEGPTLNPRSQDVLKPGMVITIEPGIYLPGIGGVRIEDLVVVTESGYTNLTSLPKKLQNILSNPINQMLK
jgi:Xaa-Pro aminopeptidase